MGKDVRSVRTELQSELGRIARELGQRVDPGGRPRDTQFSELEHVAGVLADEIARPRVEVPVPDQAACFAEELETGPECPGPASPAPDQRRGLATTRGAVQGNEPVPWSR
jgi:hypothetical protein